MTDFLCQQIPALEASILSYQEAIAAVTAANGVKEYMLDTGQTKQRVTREDLNYMNTALDDLYNRHAVLTARCTGNGVMTGRPAF